MPECPYDLLKRPEEADCFARCPWNFADSPEDQMVAISCSVSFRRQHRARSRTCSPRGHTTQTVPASYPPCKFVVESVTIGEG
jgi:hypothetical protein